MKKLSRRSVLRSSLALAASGPLARPFIANAQAKTAVCWINQGFVPAGRRGDAEGLLMIT